MSSVLFYEPFYDFERFFDDAFSPRQNRGGSQPQLRNDGDGAVRALRPRYVLH